MAVTISQVREVLKARAGGWIDAVGGRFADTFGSSGVGFRDPIAFALRQSGIVPSSPLEPVDADLTALADADIDKLLDFAEYRLLASCLQNFALVDISVGPHDEKLDQMRERLQAAVKAKLDYLGNTYGYGSATSGAASVLQAGVIGLDFQEAGS